MYLTKVCVDKLLAMAPELAQLVLRGLCTLASGDGRGARACGGGGADRDAAQVFTSELLGPSCRNGAKQNKTPRLASLSVQRALLTP